MFNPLLLKKIHITEKATDLSHLGKYVFDVAPESNSSEIKKAIEQTYNVHVVKVNMVNIKKKTTRWRRLISSSKAKNKKAIVTLRSGEKIDVVPQ